VWRNESSGFLADERSRAVNSKPGASYKVTNGSELSSRSYINKIIAGHTDARLFIKVCMQGATSQAHPPLHQQQKDRSVCLDLSCRVL